MQAASGAGGKGWEILSYTDKISQTRDYTNSVTGTVTHNGYWPASNLDSLPWPYNNDRAGGSSAITATWAPSTIPWHRFGQMGRRAFDDHTETDSGANTRTELGDGDGWYKAAYNKTKLTKVALVGNEGTVDLEEPTNSTNHLVYDLVGTSGNTTDADAGTGDYTVISLIQTLSQYNQDNATWHSAGNVAADATNNHLLFNGPDSRNFTSGGGAQTQAAYSGVCTSAAGKMHPMGKNSTTFERSEYPNLFAFWAINVDSDHDTQVCVAFHAGGTGNTYGGWNSLGRPDNMGLSPTLATQGPNQTNKGDSFRNAAAAYTFWSMWNNDWHGNTQTQNIAGNYNATYDEDTETTVAQTGTANKYTNKGTATRFSSNSADKQWRIAMQSTPGVKTPGGNDPKNETDSSDDPMLYMCKQVYFLGYSE